uniref:Uncharacterized protein n=1 Tax=Helianthus annuus TaxID=4232 RepID=A0A251VAT5_HELAN
MSFAQVLKSSATNSANAAPRLCPVTVILRVSPSYNFVNRLISSTTDSARLGT